MGVVMRGWATTAVEVFGIGFLTFGVWFNFGIGWAAMFLGAAIVAISAWKNTR